MVAHLSVSPYPPNILANCGKTYNCSTKFFGSRLSTTSFLCWSSFCNWSTKWRIRVRTTSFFSSSYGDSLRSGTFFWEEKTSSLMCLMTEAGDGDSFRSGSPPPLWEEEAEDGRLVPGSVLPSPPKSICSGSFSPSARFISVSMPLLKSRHRLPKKPSPLPANVSFVTATTILFIITQ